jgi:hypothetical protein
VYVSWNGDTETKTWRFLEVDDAGRLVVLGEVERTGFEMVFKVKASAGGKEFQVEALGADGEVLVRMSAVYAEVEFVPGHQAGSHASFLIQEL